MLWVSHKLLMSFSFWLLTAVVLVICLIPDYCICLYNSHRSMKVERKYSTVRTKQESTTDNTTRLVSRTSCELFLEKFYIADYVFSEFLSRISGKADELLIEEGKNIIQQNTMNNDPKTSAI